MNGNRTAASTGVAAIVFGVLAIVAAMMTGHPPMPEKPVADIVAWYHHHRQGVYVSQLLLAVASAALLWFAASVRHALAGRDGTGPRHAAVFSTSSSAAVALFIAGGWAQLTLAAGVNRAGEPPAPASVRLLSDLTWLHWGGLTVVAVVVGASLSMILFDGSVGARWVGGVGVVSAVLSAVGAVAAFFPNTAGKQNPIAVLGFIGFLLFALTTVLAGITMIGGSAVRGGQAADSLADAAR